MYTLENLYLAKVDRKTKETETIQEHTDKLLAQYEKLKKLYPSIKYLNWNLLKYASIYHDLGKMNTKMQNRLLEVLKYPERLQYPNEMLEKMEEVHHGYLSPAFLPIDDIKETIGKNLIDKEIENQLRILYQSIYYHHHREMEPNSDNISFVIENDLTVQWQDFYYDKVKKVGNLKPSYSRYTGISRRIPQAYDNEETVYQYIVTKGLLNKIDYAASGDIPIEVENNELYNKVMDFFKKKDFQLNALQQYMIENSDKNIVGIASTGIGKTEAGLLWIGNKKGFFTLPLRVSINAIYDRVITKVGFPKDKIGLLHSDTASEYMKRNDDDLDLQYYEKTKQYSLPLTVCTLDQLIDFVFKYNGFEIKLATLSYSKLIIDEIQMYSPELVAYLIVGLKYITEMGGRFSILTATLPPIFEDFLKREKIDYVTPKEPFFKMKDNNIIVRHKLKVLEEDINIEYIKNNYKEKKVLAIVNTVAQAQKLYDDLILALKGEEVNLFHARFTKEDRAKKEEAILYVGTAKGEKGIWITSQVVEASLDIDFDVLYTELSDVCGLFQRMGRVFRDRWLNDNSVNIYVYVGNSKLPSGIKKIKYSIIDYEIFTLSKKAILKYKNEAIITEVDKMNIIKEVYSSDNLKKSEYYKKIKNTIDKIKDVRAFEIDKKSINLRGINNTSIIPKSVYLVNKDKISRCLKTISESNNTAERLKAKDTIKNLTISIDTNFIDNRYIIEELQITKYESIPILNYTYSIEKGLEYPKNKKNDIGNRYI